MKFNINGQEGHLSAANATEEMTLSPQHHFKPPMRLHNGKTAPHHSTHKHHSKRAMFTDTMVTTLISKKLGNISKGVSFDI